MSDDASGFTTTPLIAGPCPVTVTPIIKLNGANIDIELSFLINTYPTTQIHYALGSAGLFSRFLKTGPGEIGSPSTVERFNAIKSGPDSPIIPVPSNSNGGVTDMAVVSPLGQKRNGVAVRKGSGSQNAVISVNNVGQVGNTFYPLDLIVYYGSTYSYLRVLLQK
jgi:hypothetical protein